MRQSCFFRAREISSCTLILSRERNQTRDVTCSCLVSTFIETRRDRLFMVSSRALIKIFRNVHRMISISYFCILYHKRSSETLKKCFVTLYTALRFYFHVLFSAFIILFWFSFSFSAWLSTFFSVFADALATSRCNNVAFWWKRKIPRYTYYLPIFYTKYIFLRIGLVK